MVDRPDIFSTVDAAEILDCSPTQLLTLIREGELEPPQMVGSAYAWTIEEVELAGEILEEEALEDEDDESEEEDDESEDEEE